MVKRRILSFPVSASIAHRLDWRIAALFAALAAAMLGLGLGLVFGLGLAPVHWLGAGLNAQIGGERGIAAIVSSADIDVAGIEVDVRGQNAPEARKKGWKEAQRKAWAKLEGPSLSDAQIESLVSAVVIERERIGPRRYIARLGVIFDRARAGRYLGGRERGRSSAPMLLLPVTKSGGTYLMYEKRNPWQRAWAEYQAGSSRIDYVRPSGAGGESLLLTYGQVGRRSRVWWRNILDQFEAADVLVPIVELNYTYPGGPIEARFTARYGPDSHYLGGFEMDARSTRELPDMFNRAVRRFDQMFEEALVQGKLTPDPTLNSTAGLEADPAIQRLIEIGRAALRREEAERAEAEAREAEDAVREEQSDFDRLFFPQAQATQTPSRSSGPYTVQFATPNPAAFDATLAIMRSVSGVSGVATTSTAIGGTSVMVVSYSGSLSALARALRARGYTVEQGTNALAIRR